MSNTVFCGSAIYARHPDARPGLGIRLPATFPPLSAAESEISLASDTEEWHSRQREQCDLSKTGVHYICVLCANMKILEPK